MGVDEFSIPIPTLRFLGGPFDGFVAEPDVEPSYDPEFPPWIFPDGETHPYVRMCTCHIPEWIVAPPEMDVFDAVYIWGPYLPSEGGGGTAANLTPEPLSL